MYSTCSQSVISRRFLREEEEEVTGNPTSAAAAVRREEEKERGELRRRPPKTRGSGSAELFSISLSLLFRLPYTHIPSNALRNFSSSDKRCKLHTAHGAATKGKFRVISPITGNNKKASAVEGDHKLRREKKGTLMSILSLSSSIL